MNRNELILVRDLLVYARECIKLDYDSQKEFAKRHGLSQSYVSDVLAGKRAPGEKLLAAFGIEKVVAYRFIPDSGTSGASNPLSAPGFHPDAPLRESAGLPAD